MGRSRYKIYERDAPHFLTCTALSWLPLFARPPIAQIVLDSFRFLGDHDRLTLYAYVIMENHLHLIASADDLSREVAAFKSFTARKIIECLQATNAHALLRQLKVPSPRQDRTHQVWQRGSHPQAIQGEKMLYQKLDYIHNNPVKRGYVDDPVYWRYSRARNYAGEEGLLDVTLVR